MPTPTTNYGWQKPDVGASNDAWGGLLNADLDGIDSTVWIVSGTATAALSTANTASTTANAALPTAGGTMTGTLNVNVTSAVNSIVVAPTATVGANVILNKAAGQNANIWGQQAGSSRWQSTLGTGDAESGSNAGSNFQIAAYSDAGALLGVSMQIWRATAAVAFNAIGAGLYSGAAGVGDMNLFINKAGSGHLSRIFGLNNGVFRWAISLGDQTAESSNAGSNFTLSAYNDAGAAASVPTPLTIARGTGVATFAVAIVNGSSDRRLKQNITPLEGSLDKVKALQGVSFNMIETPDKPEIGLIAQDVEPVVPEVIQTYQFTGPEGGTSQDFFSIDYPKLVAHLIEAIKTLAARVEALEAAAHG